jgi:hypothetical protein
MCSIIDQADGRFDVLVLLGTGSLFARTGFMTLVDAEEELELVHILMTACGAPVIRTQRCEDEALGWGSR